MHKVLLADDDARVRLVLRQIMARAARSIWEAGAQRVGAFACVLKEHLLQREDLVAGGSRQ